VSRQAPTVGADYPGSYADVRAWFPSDAACLDYLDWLRWPDGFWCPVCRATTAWRLADGRWSCGGCGRRVSATAGTIFHGTRTPLTIWFAAAWQMTSQKHGISALGLKRTLGIGSEQTAWAMLHRYRTAMVRPGRERLTGIVEVDETFIGGPEPGRRGRGALGKTMVEVAVEQEGRALGRCRMQVIPDISGPTLREFLLSHVEPGSIVLTDGLRSYGPACGEDYTHRPEPIGPSGQQAHELLPGVHRVAFARAALAARYPSGWRQTRTPPGLPGRVHVPFQPQTLASPGHALLPAARASGASASTHIPLARGRPRLRTPEPSASATARQACAFRQPGRRSRRSPVASRHTLINIRWSATRRCTEMEDPF
jgi:transposase-like protein